MGGIRTQLICPSFAEKVIRAIKGEKGIVEPTYVYLPGVAGGEAIAKETGVDYFSVPVELGVCPFEYLEIDVQVADTSSSSHPVLRKPTTHFHTSMTMRRNCLRLALKV